MLHDVKRIVQRYFEMLNGGDVGAVDEIIAEDCAIAVPVIPGEMRGADVIRQVVTGLRATFPDLRFSVHELIAEGDRVAASWTMEGTQVGEWLGVAGTGRELSVTGVDLFWISDGWIARVEIQADYLGAMRQDGGGGRGGG